LSIQLVNNLKENKYLKDFAKPTFYYNIYLILSLFFLSPSISLFLFIIPSLSVPLSSQFSLSLSLSLSPCHSVARSFWFFLIGDLSVSIPLNLSQWVSVTHTHTLSLSLSSSLTQNIVQLSLFSLTMSPTYFWCADLSLSLSPPSFPISPVKLSDV